VAVLFWDTSAMLRRYVSTEPSAERVRVATDSSSRHTHLVSRLLPVELASALALKTRTGEIQVPQRDAYWRVIQIDLSRQYQLVELSEAIWGHAEELLFRYVLRAGDAIHLAAALASRSRSTAQDLVFWTADNRQADAAQAEGLQVELVG
jgi:predicted nucleic acid-binding protein